MPPIRLLLVAGARPNFMKVAPIIWAIRRQNTSLQVKYRRLETGGRNSAMEAHGAENREESRVLIDFRLVHTGQHYDPQMSQVFFDELNIPKPDFSLEVGSGSHAVQTARVMKRFEPVLLNAFSEQTSGTGWRSTPDLPSLSSGGKPDWLVVVGDVNSTMACTLVASKLGVKVAHVEAGLRSFDRTMPEEINRIVTDSLAELLLTPSENATENLRREGVPEARIRLVGNVMIDTLVANLKKARSKTLTRELGVERAEFVYATLHRPANVDEPASLLAIMAELKRVAEHLPVILPMHPRTRMKCAEFGISLNGIKRFHVIEPIGYHDSLCLTEQARLIITDSGGLQEESTYFRTPCLTLRPNTERPVTITTGSNRLTDSSRLAADIKNVLAREPRYGEVPPSWDGQTAERVLDAMIATSRNDI